MKNSIKLAIIIAVLFTYSSCEDFFPAPLARFNPADPDVQIKAFFSVSSGTDSIVTAWSWTDPSDAIDSSQVIDKIRIVHKRESIPDSPFPLDSDNVKEYSDKSIWSCEWKDLKSDRDHYFVLYAHEKSGSWLKFPKIIDTYLNPMNGQDTGSLSRNVFSINTSADNNQVYKSSGDTSSDLDGPSHLIGFIQFDTDYNVGMIISATITNIGKATDDYIDIVPVYIRVEAGMTWEKLNNPDYYDYSHAVNIKISDSSDVVEITDIVNLARLYGSNTIAFIPVESSLASYNLDDSSISYDYWRQDW